MNPNTGEIKRMADLKADEKGIFKPIRNVRAAKEATAALIGNKDSVFPNFDKNPHLKKERKLMLKEERAVAIKEAADSSKEAKRAVIVLSEAGYGVHAMYERLKKEGLIK